LQAAEYEKRAAECREIAQTARTTSQRTMLLHIAETWLRLATDVLRGGDKPTRSRALGHPRCPSCQLVMTVRQVLPVMFATDVDEVVYGCRDCGTELKSTVKRAS
jgi:hypothetical protein